MTKHGMYWVVALGLAGCAVDGKGDGLQGGSEGTPGDEASSSGEPQGMTSVASTDPSVSSESSSSVEDSSSSTTCTFICDDTSDTGGHECDPWAQDCPEGEKCMPWANDGGSSWNALKCVPVDDSPGEPGDPCQVEGSGVSGIDDCGIGSMCWNTNEENAGTCVAFCEGSADNATCGDTGTTCVMANDGVLNLCLPICDPLLQDCAEGEACYPVNESFACGPDASGEMGLFGDPCEFLNVCDAGLFCASAEVVPDCVGSVGCCSSFCDLTEGAACPGAGQECVAWYEVGAAPPGMENLGACAIPE